MTNTCFRVSIVAGLALFPSVSLGLAVAGNQVVTNLPVGVKGAIVQVSVGSSTGTGTIVQAYGFEGGEVIDVLTCDHILRDSTGALGAANKVFVAFGNNGFPLYSGVALASDFTVPTGGTSAVDMAMVSIDVPANSLDNLPAITPLQISTTVAANDAIIQSGYGDQTKVSTTNKYNTSQGTNFPAYVYIPKTGLDDPLLLSGQNTVLNVTNNLAGVPSKYNPGTGIVNYQYNGITGGTSITADTSGGYNGTSYTMSGDSGGPTLELVNGKYVVVGVHSSALLFNSTDGGTPPTLLESDAISYVKDNDFLWKDVNATAYGAWITSAEATVNTNLPEPTCLAPVLLAGLTLRRTRRTSA